MGRADPTIALSQWRRRRWTSQQRWRGATCTQLERGKGSQCRRLRRLFLFPRRASKLVKGVRQRASIIGLCCLFLSHACSEIRIPEGIKLWPLQQRPAPYDLWHNSIVSSRLAYDMLLVTCTVCTYGYRCRSYESCRMATHRVSVAIFSSAGEHDPNVARESDRRAGNAVEFRVSNIHRV